METERACAEVLSLAAGPLQSNEETAFIIEAIKECSIETSA
jgi:hypothetical protein